jgi:glycogen synthase
MKLLMTADAVGGVWTYALDLARGLTGSGWSVALAVLGPSPSHAQRAEARAIAGLRLFERAGKLEWMPDPWTDVDDSGAWLQQLEHRVNPDVIHLNGYAHAALPFNVPVIVVAHSCVCSWWNAVKRTPLPVEWDEYRRRVIGGLRGARAIAAPTASMAAALRACYPIDRDIDVIANGRHTGDPGSSSSKMAMVFSAGRLWDEAKNIVALQRVAPRVAWPIYLAGDTSADPAPPIGDCVSLGRLSSHEMSAWISRASIYASPARYEPFGLTVLEAALAECALVLGDIPTLREIWGDTAWYVPPDDDGGLVDTLTMLARDARLRRKRARESRMRAREYSIERMTEGYLQLYAEACGLNVTKGAA